MTTTADLVIKQGETKTIRLEYGTEANGVFTPIDLTGWVGKAEIRAEESTTSTLLASFAVTVDGPAGAVTGVLSSVQTAALTGGFYDVKITKAGTPPTVIFLVQGRVVFDPSVTA